MELIFDFFEDHASALALVRQKRPLALGTLCFILGALSFFTALGVSGALESLHFSAIALSLYVIWELGTGFVLVAVLDLISDMEGTHGSASELFVLFGMAELAWALALPLALICMAAFPKAHNLLAAVFLLIGLFNLVLKARSLRDVYSMSGIRSWVTLLTPYAAVILFSILVFCLAAAWFFVELMHAIS